MMISFQRAARKDEAERIPERRAKCLRFSWILCASLRSLRFVANRRERRVRRESRSFVIIVDESLNTVFEHEDMKVDQQTDLQFQEPQVREQLRLIDRVKSFFRLEFNDHDSLNEEIGAEPAV